MTQFHALTDMDIVARAEQPVIAQTVDGAKARARAAVAGVVAPGRLDSKFTGSSSLHSAVAMLIRRPARTLFVDPNDKVQMKGILATSAAARDVATRLLQRVMDEYGIGRDSLQITDVAWGLEACKSDAARVNLIITLLDEWTCLRDLALHRFPNIAEAEALRVPDSVQIVAAALEDTLGYSYQAVQIGADWLAVTPQTAAGRPMMALARYAKVEQGAGAGNEQPASMTAAEHRAA